MYFYGITFENNVDIYVTHKGSLSLPSIITHKLYSWFYTS